MRFTPSIIRPKSVEEFTPPPQQFQPLAKNSRRFYPRFWAPCHTASAPAAGWIANVSMQVGGNASGRARKRQRVLPGEAMVNAVPLAARFLREGRASQPPGSGSGSCLCKRAATGPWSGPVADMAHSSRQGPCRNARPKQFPWSVRTTAGATRVEGPEEGQVDKPTPCLARPPPVGWGHHPASSGPRAVSATPLPMPADSRHGQKPHFRRHCPARPSGYPPVARKCLHLSDNVQAHLKAPANPGGICRAAMRPAASLGTVRSRAKQRRSPVCPFAARKQTVPDVPAPSLVSPPPPPS